MGNMISAGILAIPFYFIWNALAPTYFTGLPEAYRNLPFWHCVGFFVLVSIVRHLLTGQADIKVHKSWKTYIG